ncbi:MAG TPA: HDOD domain-containing protein [Polyangiaceae bacterium]|nr:HDOD domain-containing protein [Polyangiaceae bacterium]
MTDLISTTLCEELLAVFDDPGYRPPALPEVAIELMSLASKQETDVGEVVSLLERDEMLAATVLRLVGSTIYAGRTPIRSLREAVVRLGVRGVRDAVFEAALRRGVFLMPEYGDTMTSVARHSTLTAYITRIVCRRAAIDADLAFMCGLLHDVGFAGLLLAVTHFEGDAVPPLSMLWQYIDTLHERASLLLTQRWGLPPLVVEVAGHHHHLHTGDCATLAAAVRLADHLSEHFGATVLGPPAGGAPMPGDTVELFDVETACAELNIDGTALKLIIADAERTVPEIVLL